MLRAKSMNQARRLKRSILSINKETSVHFQSEIPIISFFKTISSRSMATRVSRREDRSTLLPDSATALSNFSVAARMAFFHSARGADAETSESEGGDLEAASAASASFSSRTASSKSARPPIHLPSTSGCLRSASSRNSRDGPYADKVRCTTPRIRDRTANSSSVSRSGTVLSSGDDAYGLFIEIAGDRLVKSRMCVSPISCVTRACVFQTVEVRLDAYKGIISELNTHKWPVLEEWGMSKGKKCKPARTDLLQD